MTAYTMTFGGWISLSLSLGFVIGLFVWCMARVLRGGPPKKGKRPKGRKASG